MLDGGWLDVWWLAGEGFAIGVEFVAPLVGECFQSLAGGLGVADSFVINVGEVTDVEGGCAACLKGPAEDVLQDEGAKISDMGGAIDGGAAAVEAEGFAVGGTEFLALAGEGIE